MLPAPELHVRGALAPPGAHPGDQLRQPAVPVRAHHQVHLGDALEQLGAEPLRHAPHHAEHAAGPLAALQLPYARQHLLLGMVTHRAGVHQHDVRRGGIVDGDVALPLEHAEHELGVRDVHLAAVRLDVDARHGYRTVTSKRALPFHS